MDLIRIGSFLAELRHEKGLTQQALGERLGVTNKTISRWETGCYLPDVEMLSLLSREFGVSINELVAGERLVAEDFTFIFCAVAQLVLMIVLRIRHVEPELCGTVGGMLAILYYAVLNNRMMAYVERQLYPLPHEAPSRRSGAP